MDKMYMLILVTTDL